LTKTGIDGYGVPARNDIFANAMMFRECHCHHDAVRFYRNAVIAVAVMENVVRCVNPRVALCSTLGCLTLAALTGLVLRLIRGSSCSCDFWIIFLLINKNLTKSLFQKSIILYSNMTETPVF
jgi:hypothetical protein